MNIIEAAKTGLPMRPVKESRDNPWSHFWNPKLHDIHLTLKEIKGDWEVDEPKVTFTRRELEAAYKKCWAGKHLPNVDEMADELGL